MADALAVAQANGIVVPAIAWHAAAAASLEYPVLCAFLEQESAGGHNVFGHDGGADGWYSGAGEVTEEKYGAYRAGRATHGAQGVGPLQLTWPPYQDRADGAGGCWKPAVNVHVGAQILADLYQAHGRSWRAAATAWNGSSTYADQLMPKITRWRVLLADTTPPGGGVDIYAPQPYYGYQYSDGTPMRTCVRDLQALELLRADLHAAIPGDYSSPLFIYQGCFHDGDLSAGTHTGSSVYDLHPSDAALKAQIGARHGIIVFHRPPNWDGKGGGEHLHCIIRGGQKMAPEAHAQVLDWDKHLDGLADGGRYTGPWYPVKPFIYHAPKDPPPPKGPPHQPPPASLLETWQRRQGDAVRALEASVEAGQAFTAAQPHRPVLAAILQEEQTSLNDERRHWRTTFEATH